MKKKNHNLSEFTGPNNNSDISQKNNYNFHFIFLIKCIYIV